VVAVLIAVNIKNILLSAHPSAVARPSLKGGRRKVVGGQPIWMLESLFLSPKEATSEARRRERSERSSRRGPGGAAPGGVLGQSPEPSKESERRRAVSGASGVQASQSHE